MNVTIDKLKIAEFEKVKKELCILQHQNVLIHLRDKKIDKIYSEGKIEEIYKYMQEEKAFVFIAKYEEKVIGFLWCYPKEFFDENRIVINSLIVQEEYRNQKIGERLIQEAILFGEKNNYNAIDVITPAFNDGALRFYRRQGFTDERIQLVIQIDKEKA